MVRIALILIVALLAIQRDASAQFITSVLGANRPFLHWKELHTKHFILTYDEGLDSVARLAAPMAEEAYRVVTGNLHQTMAKPLRIYLSNTDEVKNSFAFQNRYLYIWMRGILDDEPFAIRASGSSKWLRSVITHELTHAVIDEATRDWTSDLFPFAGGVPRWFNEGMARYMEPDGWTPDLDIALRMAVVSGQLELGLDHFLGGTLLYEGGQSLVRFIAATYGDSTLREIIHYRPDVTYDFDEAVKHATGQTMDDIFAAWKKAMVVYYGTQYGSCHDIATIGRKVPSGLAIIYSARVAPDGHRIAIFGNASEDASAMLYVLPNDTSAEPLTISTESGIQPEITWSPDGRYLLFSKLHWGSNATMVYDLYRCEVPSGKLERLTTDARLEQPDCAPNGEIVAVRSQLSGSDLVLLSADGNLVRDLTHFDDPNVNVYAPRWSPNGKEVAFSIFRKNGQRDIAVVTIASDSIHYMTNDSINDRYPVWSHAGDSLVFVRFTNGIPNCSVISASGGSAIPVTNVASNIQPWDWSATKDSILVSSFEYRTSVQLYWIPAHLKTDMVESRSTNHGPKLDSQYVSWRTVHWPLVTKTMAELTPTVISGPTDYSSIAQLRPQLYFPLIGSEVAQSGKKGEQWGAGVAFADDLGKHELTVSALYGDASHLLSYDIDYVNRTWYPDIIIGGGQGLSFVQTLEDVPYYERQDHANFGLHWEFPTPDELESSHQLYFGMSYAHHVPWNSIAFDSVPDSHKPIDFRSFTLAADYEYLSPLVQAGISASHFDKALGSTLTRTRLQGFLNAGVALDDDANFVTAVVLHADADLGDEIPQDYLGFSSNDVFDGGLNLMSLSGPRRIRGVRRNYYGNRLLEASFEFRTPDWIVGNVISIVNDLQPQLVEWVEAGTTWYATAPDNNPGVTTTALGKTQWLKSAGAELRLQDLGFGIAGGVGWELVKNPLPDWYFRFISEF